MAGQPMHMASLKLAGRAGPTTYLMGPQAALRQIVQAGELSEAVERVRVGVPLRGTTIENQGIIAGSLMRVDAGEVLHIDVAAAEMVVDHLGVQFGDDGLSTRAIAGA